MPTNFQNMANGIQIPSNARAIIDQRRGSSPARQDTNRRTYVPRSQYRRPTGGQSEQEEYLPDAAQSKRGYTAPERQNLEQLRENMEVLGYDDSKRADAVTTAEDEMYNAMQGYLDANYDGQELFDFLVNADADEMYGFVTAPDIAKYYAYYGDFAKDRDAYDKWFINNEKTIDFSDPDQIYSDAYTVANLYGTDPYITNYINTGLVQSGLSMSRDDGSAVTYEDLGIDPSSEDAANQYIASNINMMNQGVLGSNIYAGRSKYYNIDAINDLANEKIEYGYGDDYDMNVEDNPRGIRDTIGNIPSYEDIWIFDPDVYAMSVSDEWNNDGLGSAYSGLANLLASGAGLGYTER